MASLPDQSATPYLDALREHAARNPARLYVPGHKGGPGAAPALLDAIGERALALDIPALTHGIDTGVEPNPFQQSQDLAAQAYGAARSWFLINGASQGNHVALLTLAHAGDRVVVQRNAHSSTVDGCILAGLRPTFVAPEVDGELGIAHCLTPEALDTALTKTPGAVGATVVSPSYFGAVADIEGLAGVAHDHAVPLVVDEAWGAHLAFHESLPAHALSLGADLVVSSTHKIIGSLTQSAIVHLAKSDRPLVDQAVVDRAVTLVESTSPSALLLASLDAARQHAAMHGRELLGETIVAMAKIRDAVREIGGLDVLDERLVGATGVHAYDPLRLAIDVRGTGASGYDVAGLLRDHGDIHLELAGENVIVGVFGMAEPAAPQGERLVTCLRKVVEILGDRGDRTREAFAPPPPWGELVLSPREAFLGPQEAVSAAEAVGRIAAESLAAYPPGIPNVLPGERLTVETLTYIQTALEHGGSLRGASDRRLGTIRVVTGRSVR
jgi:arginine decarboxylase